MMFPTPPLTVINLPADANHHTKGRGGFQTAFIVVHHTGGVDSRAWLSRTSSPPVSCHRLIDKAGRNYKIVDDADTAYCAGFGLVGPVDPDSVDPAGIARNLNQASLNIELENAGDGVDPYTPAQMQMCAAQIVEWWGRSGFLPILSHAQVDARKNDPRGFDWADLHRRMLAQIPGGALALPPAIDANLRAAVENARMVIVELGQVLTWRADQ